MPTIGNTTPGSTTRTFNVNCKGIRVPSFPAAGTIDSIEVYISDSATGDSFTAHILSSDLTTVLASSDSRTNISTAGWYTFTGGTLTGYSIAAGVDRLFVVASMSAASALFYFNSGTETYDGYTAQASITDDNPLTWGTPSGMNADSTRDYSVKINYTDAGGVSRSYGFIF